MGRHPPILDAPRVPVHSSPAPGNGSAVRRILLGMGSPRLAMAALAAVVAMTAACSSAGSGGAVTGEVRFAREVELPEGAVVTVKLLDTSLADAPAVELGRDVIENAERLPVRFRIEFDPDEVAGGREYSLSAEVRRGDELLYINDTVHPVLTRGAPKERDVVVVSTNPFDTCVEPLPGMIHSSFEDQALPEGAVLHVRLIDVTEPEEPVLVTETSKEGLDGFPIEFELPYEGVRISRHHRYELEAEIVAGDTVLYHIAREEWRRVWLPHCPGEDLQLINDVFPADEFPRE